MKTYVKYVLIAVVAGWGIFLFYLSAAAWGNLIATKEKVMFYLEQPISVREADGIEKQIREEKENNGQQETEDGTMTEFCIWGQKDAVMLTNENLFRNAQANAVFLCGNPEVLFEDCRLPARNDSQGCLIDEETAWELFGSTQVVGKEISYDGKTDGIRSEIAGDDKIFAIQVSNETTSGMGGNNAPLSGSSGDSQPEGQIAGNSGTAGSLQDQAMDNNVLNRLTVRKPADKSVRDLYLAWSSRFGVDITVLDVEFLRGVGGFCVLLFPITSGICLLCYLFYECRQQKKLVLKVVPAALILIIVLCLFTLFQSHVQIPDDYIPSRWSDFSFWAQLWEQKWQAVRMLVQMPKTDLDSGWIEAFVRTLGFGIFAVTAFLLWFGLFLLTRFFSSRK